MTGMAREFDVIIYGATVCKCNSFCAVDCLNSTLLFLTTTLLQGFTGKVVSERIARTGEAKGVDSIEDFIFV
jgi:hypothetical protein